MGFVWRLPVALAPKRHGSTWPRTRLQNSRKFYPFVWDWELSVSGKFLELTEAEKSHRTTNDFYYLCEQNKICGRIHPKVNIFGSNEPILIKLVPNLIEILRRLIKCFQRIL